jgi:hypothetical protein
VLNIRVRTYPITYASAPLGTRPTPRPLNPLDTRTARCFSVVQVYDRLGVVRIFIMLIGSPHRLNSDFAFYTHSKHYLNITTHFRILFRIFGAHSTSSQLIRTSEAHFGNFGPISDLRSLFQKLRIYFGPPKIISETSHL